MRKIILEPVENGLIKTVYDDSIDGAGKILDKKEIFILEDNIGNTERIILSLISDLGLFTGNEYDKETLKLNKSFGDKYQLSSEDLNEERKKLSLKLNNLKQQKQLFEHVDTKKEVSY